MAKPNLSLLQPALAGAKMVALLLPTNPTYDQVASALALKLSLTHAGKTVSIACPDAMTVEFNRLVGVESITQNFGSRNFVISFPGQTDIVDKVTYNVEAGELQLVITPKSGTVGIDHRLLKFTSAGIQAELVITIGVNDLNDLGHIYGEIREFLQTAKLFSLSHANPTANYTPNEIYDVEASSLSEVTTHLISDLGFSLNSDAASNLLAGLESSTDFYKSPLAGAGSFEAAAILLRAGAKRHDIYSPQNLPIGSIPQATPPQSITQVSEPEEKNTPLVNPSPDWYEPKVYRGTNVS